MKNIKKLGASFLVSTGLFLFIGSSVSASTPYLASDVLGQSGSFITDLTNNIATPNASGLRSPNGMALDTVTHQLFISDKSNHRIIIHNLDVNNNIIDRTPDYVLGQMTFSTRDTALSQNGLNNPQGLAVDSINSLLYVADSSNNRVMVFDYATIVNGENAVNVLGQADFTFNTSAKTRSTFNNPQGLYYDSATSTLYVGDTNNARLLTFDLTSITNGENAVNVLGDTDFTGTATGVVASTLYSPTGITLDTATNRLFVSDTGVDRVVIYDIATLTDGEAAINVLGKSDINNSAGGSPASTASSLNNPTGLEYDPTNDLLYVADRLHSRVMIFNVAAITNGEDAVNVLGQQLFTTYFSQADDVELSYPNGVVLSGDTLFVLAELDHRVLAFDVATVTDGENAFNILGQTDAVGGPRYTAFQANNIYPSSSSYFNPTSVALDSQNHRLFVSDWGNNRILVHNLDSKNRYIDQIADGVIGQPNFLTDEDGLTQNQLLLPDSIAYDPVRNWLFVAEANNSRVIVFDVATVTNGENAIYVLGQADFTSQDITADASSLDYPNAVSYDSARQLLFVNDGSFNRILVFNVASISNGESAVNVIGQPDFTTVYVDGQNSNQLNYPNVVEFDSTTNWLFVSDTYNHRVLVFDTTTIIDGMSAGYVLGSNDLNAAGTTAPTQSSLYQPEGLAIDRDNRRLFVADYNDRVMIFDIASITNGENAVGIIGRSTYTDSSATTLSQSSIESWGDMIFDDTFNNLVISEAPNHRVLLYEFIRITTASLASGNMGSVYNRSITNENSQGTVTYSLSSGSLPSGITLSSAGVLSGTPTVTGTFNVSITVTDNNGVAGTFTDTKPFSLVIGGVDSDGDGISDAVENAGPNGGDANGDSVLDSAQPGIATNTNKVTSGHTTIQSSAGNVSSFSVLAESDLTTQNPSADFPVGLNSFTVTGLSNGASTTVTVYYDQLYDTNTWTFMKYSPSNNSYTNMDSVVTYSTANIGGSDVTTASYVLTDGGQFDEDGVANGTIIDPAGPMVSSGSLADTGIDAYLYVLAGFILIIPVAVLAYLPAGNKYRS